MPLSYFSYIFLWLCPWFIWVLGHLFFLQLHPLSVLVFFPKNGTFIIINRFSFTTFLSTVSSFLRKFIQKFLFFIIIFFVVYFAWLSAIYRHYFTFLHWIIYYVSEQQSTERFQDQRVGIFLVTTKLVLRPPLWP